MIPVAPAAEPVCFDSKVRKPGSAFLKKHALPKTFDGHTYWTKIGYELCSFYNNICAYSGCRIINDNTVDHFLPKSKYPLLAYEWSNYRLCSAKINAYKSSDDTIIDPFYIKKNWFYLQFPSCLVIINNDLPVYLKSRIDHTIKQLRLNNNQLVEFRLNMAQLYATGGMELDALKYLSPFVAGEICRQNLRGTMKNLFP